MKTSPEPLPFLVISGPPLETFCAKYNLPLERFTDRFSGDWWAFLFLCEAGPMLTDLETLLGFTQQETAGQFVEESCWIEDFPDWDYSATNEVKLAALQGLMRKDDGLMWWKEGRN